MKEILKNNKGITLVALVVTIIILIILAGISINILTGTDGLIAKTKQAKENMELATIEEQTALNEIYGQLDNGVAVAGNNFANQTIGTATSDKILKDYTAYVNGQLVTGNMNDYSENIQEITLIANHTSDTEYNISEGYHKKMKVDASALYEAAYNAGRMQGQKDVTDSPNTYNLYTKTQYDDAIEEGKNQFTFTGNYMAQSTTKNIGYGTTYFTLNIRNKNVTFTNITGDVYTSANHPTVYTATGVYVGPH